MLKAKIKALQKQINFLVFINYHCDKGTGLHFSVRELGSWAVVQLWKHIMRLMPQNILQERHCMIL